MTFLAILISAVVGMIVGALWYSPILFGKTWMKLTGLTKSSMKSKKKGMGKSYFGMFISLLVMAYALSLFLNVNGLMGAFWIWLGFIATIMFGSVIWEGKPLKLYFLNAFHWLAVILVMGSILSALSP